MESIKSDSKIAILMATYNGDEYLSQQIDSILSQTYQQWHLFVHDDGSADRTVSILNDYVKKYPKKITIIDYPPQGGALQNFMSLLEYVESEYYMFSDQDDIWIKEKISMEMERMSYEEQHHPNTPIIVFSDLFVVDTNLCIISNSFMSYSGIYPEYLTTFESLAASNHTTGCTMLFNHNTKKTVKYPFTVATMHDAWITLCAIKAHGILNYISKPLVFYRQHNNNTLGASNIKRLTTLYRLQHLKQIIQQNQKTYRMMSFMGYGTWFKFLYHKIKYKCFILRKQLKK